MRDLWYCYNVNKTKFLVKYEGLSKWYNLKDRSKRFHSKVCVRSSISNHCNSQANWPQCLPTNSGLHHMNRTLPAPASLRQWHRPLSSLTAASFIPDTCHFLFIWAVHCTHVFMHCFSYILFIVLYFIFYIVYTIYINVAIIYTISALRWREREKHSDSLYVNDSSKKGNCG